MKRSYMSSKEMRAFLSSFAAVCFVRFTIFSRTPFGRFSDEPFCQQEFPRLLEIVFQGPMHKSPDRHDTLAGSPRPHRIIPKRQKKKRTRPNERIRPTGRRKMARPVCIVQTHNFTQASSSHFDDFREHFRNSAKPSELPRNSRWRMKHRRNHMW